MARFYRLRPGSANGCAIFSAIDFVFADEMFDITATTIPRSGNVIRYVAAPRDAALAAGRIRQRRLTAVIRRDAGHRPGW